MHTPYIKDQDLTAHIFAALIDTKRAEELLLHALGKVLRPEAHRPSIAEAVGAALGASRAAILLLRSEVARLDRGGNKVVPLHVHTARRAKSGGV